MLVYHVYECEKSSVWSADHLSSHFQISNFFIRMSPNSNFPTSMLTYKNLLSSINKLTLSFASTSFDCRCFISILSINFTYPTSSNDHRWSPNFQSPTSAYHQWRKLNLVSSSFSLPFPRVQFGLTLKSNILRSHMFYKLKYEKKMHIPLKVILA